MKTKIYKYELKKIEKSLGKSCFIIDGCAPAGKWKASDDISKNILPIPIPRFINKYKTKLWKLNKYLENALGNLTP